MSQKTTKKPVEGQKVDQSKVTEKNAKAAESDVDVVFRASKLILQKDQFKQISEKHWQEKDLILREIQIFETNPSNVDVRKTNEILRNLRDILKRRTALHEKEETLIDDITQMERLTAQIKNTDQDSKLRSHARANLEGVLGKLMIDIKGIDRERNNIMEEFQNLRTFEFGGTQPSDYGKLGFNAKGVPDPQVKDEGPNLALDAIKITEFLNKNYDKLYKKNPKLAKELEAIVKYLQGSDFTREFKSPDAGDMQRNLDQIEVKKANMDHQQARKIEKQNKAAALKEYQSKLEKAGREMLAVDYNGTKNKSQAANDYAYGGNFEGFVGESPMYQALYGKPEKDALEGLLEANKRVIANNGNTAGLLKDEISKNEEKRYGKTLLDMELSKKRALLEKEKMELEIAKEYAKREKKPIESKVMFNAMSNMTDTMGMMHDNYSNLIKTALEVTLNNLESKSRKYYYSSY